MLSRSPQSPEARRHRGSRGAGVKPVIARIATMEVLKRVVVGVYSDGLIHAGNLAYLTLVALFPFFIVAAAVAQILGATQAGIEAVNGFLLTVPPSVANVLRPAIVDVLSARTGSLLWIGAIVGLWTTGSLVETIRDILRRAYGTKSTQPFWHYRLGAIGIILLSVLGAMFALSLQVMVSTVDTVVSQLFPFAEVALGLSILSRVGPTLILYGALHLLFIALTPGRYRSNAFPKWPGAVFVALWWYGTAQLLPFVLAHLTSYSLTYGGLAGTMITLIFFFIIGLGMVIGAELNAALAEFPVAEALAEETEERSE